MACPHCDKEPDYEFDDNEKKEDDYDGENDSFNIPPFIPPEVQITHDFSDMLPSNRRDTAKRNETSNRIYRTASSRPNDFNEDSLVTFGPVS